MTPFAIRKRDAATGFAKRIQKTCARASPRIPTGTVAMTTSHARRSESVSMWRRKMLPKKPVISRGHSFA